MRVFSLYLLEHISYHASYLNLIIRLSPYFMSLGHCRVTFSHCLQRCCVPTTFHVWINACTFCLRASSAAIPFHLSSLGVAVFLCFLSMHTGRVTASATCKHQALMCMCAFMLHAGSAAVCPEQREAHFQGMEVQYTNLILAQNRQAHIKKGPKWLHCKGQTWRITVSQL
jgi:hypothetical protein